MFKNSRGYTEVFVIIIVIFAAFLLAGGQLLFQDKSDTSSSSDSPGSSSSSDTWSISYESKGCATDGEQIAITAKGPGTGNTILEIKNGSDYQIVGSSEFSNLQPWSITLLKTLGFDTKPWRLRIVQGGSRTGDTWTGGAEKASTPDVTSSPCP